jgi:hypothetical protein
MPQKQKLILKVLSVYRTSWVTKTKNFSILSWQNRYPSFVMPQNWNRPSIWHPRHDTTQHYSSSLFCDNNMNNWLRPTDCCNQHITVASNGLLPAANNRLLPPEIIVPPAVNNRLEYFPHLLFTWPWCPCFHGSDGQFSPQKASVVGIDDKSNGTVRDFKLLGLTNFERPKTPLLPLMRVASVEVKSLSLPGSQCYVHNFQ